MTGAAESRDRQTTRADAQRDRILCAALKCFIEHGFHAASMARIAEEAQMSAGLMYRYFENKSAIVLAIVERQLEERRAMIRQLQGSEQIAEGLLDTFRRWTKPDPGNMSVALFLEMSAEATRNPQIAAALGSSDSMARTEFQEWLARPKAQGGLGMPARLAASRAMILRCIVDGLALRAAREPDLDQTVLKSAMDDLLAWLLP